MGLDNSYYTIEEVAKLLRVSVRTVYRWIKQGNLKALQIMEGGGYRIPKTEIQRFYEHNMA